MKKLLLALLIAGPLAAQNRHVTIDNASIPVTFSSPTVTQGTPPWTFRLQDGTTSNLAAVNASGQITFANTSINVGNFPATQAVSIAATVNVDVTDRSARLLGYTSNYDDPQALTQGMTALRDSLVAQRYTVLADSVADGLASFWTNTAANGGSIAVTVGEGVLATSANALGSAQMTSTSVTYYPGQVSWMNSAIRLGDTGSVGNIRRWGVFTVSGTTPQDGYYYELTGTTLNAVSAKAGVLTPVASTSWTKFSTAPFTLDLNYHQFEIRWTANSVQFLIDNVLRHTATGGATAITQTLNFPMTIHTVNSSGSTDRQIAVRNIGIGRFGEPQYTPVTGTVAVTGTVTDTQGPAATVSGAWPMKVTDGTTTAAVNAVTKRLLVDATGSVIPLPANAAQETGGNLAAIVAAVQAILAQTPTQVNGSTPVTVKATAATSPVLSAAQLSNPLLYRAAMQQFCSTNLCPPGALGK